MDDTESALVRLARLTKVKAHRRVSAFGHVEQVDSYVRKNLDPYGPGASAKTRLGAFVAKNRLDIPQPTSQTRGKGGGSKTYTSSEIVREIESRGGVAVRQVGSHQRFMVEYPGGKVYTVVPRHKGDTPTGTMRSIARDLAPAFGKGWL